MKWTVTTPPADRPVTWAECKAHLRIDGNDVQAYVESLIDVATDFAEDAIAGSLVSRTITAEFAPFEPLNLPRGPVFDVVSVASTGKPVTDYDLERVGHSDRIVGVAGRVSVVYQAGYPTPAAIPASIRHAIKMHVATLFDRRESASDKTVTDVPQSLRDFYRLKCRDSGVM